ncbi:conjugal transfer protein TraN, partial [Pseudomonas helleri]
MNTRSFAGTIPISMSVRLFFTTVLFFFVAGFSICSLAADCRKTGQTCVEGPETRNIAGNLIYQGCWRYRSTYECIKPEAIDYCAAISRT